MIEDWKAIIFICILLQGTLMILVSVLYYKNDHYVILISSIIFMIGSVGCYRYLVVDKPEEIKK